MGELSGELRYVRPQTPRQSDPATAGRHRILGRLGGGGMGQVYLADGPLGPVAVKVIRHEIADEPVFRSRFRREVQACFRVSGPATARLLDFDLDADPPWLATEFFDAPDLGRLVQAGGPLATPAQFALAAGLAEALVSIHAAGLVHRDLKPSNVMCSLDGPRVIDFGVAMADDNRSLTATGAVVGTPGWLSPEQVTAGEATAASDVFAVGGLISYAASGEPPYGTGPTPAVLLRIATEAPRTGDPRLAEGLRDVVGSALARSAADRPTSRELRDEVLRVAGAAGAGGGTVPGAPATLAALLERGWHVPPLPPLPDPTADRAAGSRRAAAAAPGRDDALAAEAAAAARTAPAGNGTAAAGQSIGPTAVRATPEPTSPPPGGSPPGGSPPGGSPPGAPRRTRMDVPGDDERYDVHVGGERTARREGRGLFRGHGRWFVAAAIVGLLLAGGVIAAVLLLAKGSDGGGSADRFTASAPWRMIVEDNIEGQDNGCTVSMTNTATGTPVTLPNSIYDDSRTIQIAATGSFRWTVNDSGCLVVPMAGSGSTRLPFSQGHAGDTDAFAAPASGIVGVEVKDFNGSESCGASLHDPADGQELDSGQARTSAPSFTLSTGGRANVYVSVDSCAVMVRPGS